MQGGWADDEDEDDLDQVVRPTNNKEPSEPRQES